MSTKSQPLGLDINLLDDERFNRGLSYAIVLALALGILIPYLWVIGSSFKTPGDIFAAPMTPLPPDPTLRNWVEAWDVLGSFVVNSIIMGVGTAVLSLIATIPAAYAFGRVDFPGRELLFYGTVTAMLFPFILLVIPITALWRDIGLWNTFPGIMIAHQIWVLPLSIWILRDFFEELPVNLEEAAQVYGCTQFEAFYRVILPLAAPPVAAVGFLAFLHGWNEFLFTNLLASAQGPITATVKLFAALHSGSGDQIRYGLLMSMTLIVAIPPAAVYMYVRRYLSAAFAVD
jgi:ABC-type glycerol-3-phosphate transport system permease component